MPYRTPHWLLTEFSGLHTDSKSLLKERRSLQPDLALTKEATAAPRPQAPQLIQEGSEVLAGNVTGRLQGQMTIICTHGSDLGLCSCVCSRNHIWPQDAGTTYLRKGARVGHVATQGSPWPQASGSSLCETYTPFCHIPQSGHSTGLF